MKTKNGNIALVMVVIVIVAITAGVIGYLFAKKNQTPIEPIAQSVPQTKQDQQQTQQAVDETADWQTYTDSKNGLEFKYPSDWKNDKTLGAKYVAVGGVEIAEVSNVLCCRVSFDEGMDMKIFYSKDFSKYPTMQNLFAEKTRGYSKEVFDADSYLIGNFKGIRIKTKANSSSIYQEDIELYAKSGNGFYTILWNSSDPNKKGLTAQAYLEKIISTFKFPNQMSQSYLEIKELGIKLPVDSSAIGDLTYKTVDANANSVIFSSKSLAAASKYCGDGKSGVVISKVQGTPSNPKDGGDPVFYKGHMSDIKQFDGFFLLFQGLQDSCTMGKNVDLENKISGIVRNGFENVVIMK